MCNHKKMMGRNVNPGLTEPIEIVCRYSILRHEADDIPRGLSERHIASETVVEFRTLYTD